jgi:hypothetical protein
MGKTHKQFNFFHMTVKNTQFDHFMDIYFNYKLVIFIISSDRNLTLIDYRCGMGSRQSHIKIYVLHIEGCEAGTVKLRINII